MLVPPSHVNALILSRWHTSGTCHVSLLVPYRSLKFCAIPMFRHMSKMIKKLAQEHLGGSVTHEKDL